MEKIAKYIILEEIGRGGMGCVYRARDPVIEREVAIKVILERALDVPEIRERFYREARSAGRLAHDNIVVVHDVGEADDLPYIVMEFLEGSDLREAMDRTELPVVKKLDIALAICRGLRYAHDHGVVHRDIKPENVRIVDGSRVKIVDFGIARLDSGTQTLTHASIGTPRYMSPEQIKGTAVDHRTDIFSFGVLLYELMTGNLPFRGDHVTTLIYKILHEVPEPIELDDSRLTGQLQEIVSRCLAKSPDERYLDFGGVIEDLERVVSDLDATRTLPNETVMLVGRPRRGSGVAAEPSQPRPKALRIAAAVIVGLLVVGGTFAVAFWESAPWNATILAQSTSSVEESPLDEDTGPMADAVEEVPVESEPIEDEPTEDVETKPDSEPPVEQSRPEEPDAVAQRDELQELADEEVPPAPKTSEEVTDAGLEIETGEIAEEEEESSAELRIAADDARASMRSVKGSIPPSVVDSRPYQRAVAFENEGSQAFASGDFERAGDRFQLAEGSYAEAAAPELIVTSEARAIQARLKEAIMNDAWSGVPQVVHDGYAKHVSDLRKFWRISDVTISSQPPRIDASAATLPVTVTIHYVQPGGFDPGNYSLFFDWTWMMDGGMLRLAQVQLIRTSQ